MNQNHHRYLFQLISWLTKYLFLKLFALSIVYIILFTFGLAHIFESLFAILLKQTWRLGIILVCLIAIAMIFDSFFNRNKK